VSSVSPLDRRLIRYVWYVLLAATLASETWRKWPDPAVDFGHELYTPWRLSEGAVLYRDVASLYGPLSQSFNGLLFRLFGVSFTTLIFANLALLLLLVVVVDTFFSESLSGRAAFAATTILLTVFAFGQYQNIGNYNFIAPYAHEATHALILGVLTVFLVTRWLRSATLVWVALAGVTWGLLILTKPETTVATTFAILLAGWLGRRAGQPIARAAMIFVGTAALPIVSCFVMFQRVLPFTAAWHATLGAWISARTVATSTSFYARSLGIDAPLRNLGLMALATAGLAGLIGLGLAADRATLPVRQRNGIAVLLALLTLGVGVAAPIWEVVPRALLPFSAGMILWGWRRRHNPLAVWAAFSLAMLGRIALKPEFSSFGFVLALPAALLLAGALIELAPPVTRAIGAAFLLAMAIAHVRMTETNNADKDFVAGPAGDGIVVRSPDVSSKTAAFLRAAERLRELLPAGGTMAALPEGVILNYWTRTRAPTRYVNLMPTELAAYGEENIVEAYRQSPPDVMVLVHSDASQFGLPPFGQDPRYGGRLMGWVRANYDLNETILADPASYERFGMQILTRRK
jgi:hypothetical protein